MAGLDKTKGDSEASRIKLRARRYPADIESGQAPDSFVGIAVMYEKENDKWIPGFLGLGRLLTGGGT